MPERQEGSLSLPDVIGRIADVSPRPRYTFMVLNLIAKAADRNGQAGPYVLAGDGRVPVRDWLCDALVPMAQRDPRRRAVTDVVRAELVRDGLLPAHEGDAEKAIEAEVRRRVRQSGRCNVSRAVSDLVRADLLRRHYRGYRVDHQNRGAQREAVYTISEQARDALRL